MLLVILINTGSFKAVPSLIPDTCAPDTTCNFSLTFIIRNRQNSQSGRGSEQKSLENNYWKHNKEVGLKLKLLS